MQLSSKVFGLENLVDQSLIRLKLSGQFETEEEREAKVREKMLKEEAKFSSFLLHQSDRQDYLDSNMVEEEEEEEEEEASRSSSSNFKIFLS